MWLQSLPTIDLGLPYEGLASSYNIVHHKIMKIRNNSELISNANMLEMTGASSEKIKEAFIRASTFDVDLDTPIYRIFQLKYLRADIEAGQITLVQALPTVWKDDLENPLLNVECNVDGEKCSIREMMSSYYAQCWTKDPVESGIAWSDFAHSQSAVRVKTTLRKLLNRLVDIGCSGYSVRFFAGAVDYCDPSEIEGFRHRISNDCYSVLDSLGHGLANSVMLLSTNHKHEEEVRVLYSHMSGSPWIDRHVQVKSDNCSLPFHWVDFLDEVLYPARFSKEQVEELVLLFMTKNSNCEIGPSKY